MSIFGGHVVHFWKGERCGCCASRWREAFIRAQGTVCKIILDQEEVKPHKARYYLEQRDPDFAE